MNQTNYHIELPVFEGPLDLLLYLIHKNEVDIFDIPIAQITHEYLIYLGKLKTLNIDLASEFILMAATLTVIKSKLLLPPQADEEDEFEAVDPRKELVEQLLEYKKYKNAGLMLESFHRLDRDLFKRPSLVEASEEIIGRKIDISLFDLVSAFQEIVNKVKAREGITLDAERYTIQEAIDSISAALNQNRRQYFEDLFQGAKNRLEMIVLFLALLEIIKMGLARVYQMGNFEPIIVEKRES
jgi:segregation and condensation protein A